MDLEKWLKKLKISRDFTSAALCSAKCDTTTKRYYVIITLRAGAEGGGHALSLLIVTVLLFHTLLKGILPSPRHHSCYTGPSVLCIPISSGAD
jgi:hypothetical protein